VPQYSPGPARARGRHRLRLGTRPEQKECRGPSRDGKGGRRWLRRSEPGRAGNQRMWRWGRVASFMVTPQSSFGIQRRSTTALCRGASRECRGRARVRHGGSPKPCCHESTTACVAVSGMPRPELDIDLNQGYPSPGRTLGEGEPVPTRPWAGGKYRCGVYLPTGVSLPSGPEKTGPRD
jgi:hypothetical protein